MPDRLMLLDTASLYFRAFYGLPDTIRRADGTPVNAVRGLLDMIARLTTAYRATHLIACWDDDWRPQWRVDLLPTYKAHRVAEAVTGREFTLLAAGLTDSGFALGVAPGGDGVVVGSALMERIVGGDVEGAIQLATAFRTAIPS